MSSATVSISAVPMPCVVTAGVPMRRPLVMYGGRGSSGTVFSLSEMPARSRARRAFLPDSSASKVRRSTSIRWLSVPPDTRRRPRVARPSASAGGVGDDARRVVLELRLRSLEEAHRLGRDHVVVRAALEPGEHRLVDPLGELLGAQDRRRPRAAQGLVRRERHDVGAQLDGVRVLAAGDEAGDVGGVEQEQRADLVGDGAQRLRVDDARVGGGAGDDQLRPVLERQVAQRVHVDALVGLRDAVGHEPVQPARRVDRRAVGEVAALVEAQAEHGVARLEHGLVARHVGVGPRVRLHVGVRRAEQRLGPLPGELLDLVDDLVAAVVPLARVALAVLVREHRARRPQHRRRREVLAGDQLQRRPLALLLGADEVEQLAVGFRGPRHQALSSSSMSRIWARRASWRPPSYGVDSHSRRISSARP